MSNEKLERAMDMALNPTRFRMLVALREASPGGLTGAMLRSLSGLDPMVAAMHEDVMVRTGLVAPHQEDHGRLVPTALCNRTFERIGHLAIPKKDARSSW